MENKKRQNYYFSMTICGECGYPVYVFSNDMISPSQKKFEYEFDFFVQCPNCYEWVKIKVRV